MKFNGGENGIRTHERVTPLHAFQACAFNHSATSPKKLRENLSKINNDNIYYHNIGDVGISKSLNYAVSKSSNNYVFITQPDIIWRGGRVVEGARLESVYRGNSIMGSNPILSAKII